MVELVGDICAPSDLLVPIRTTTQINAISGAMLSGGLVFNATSGKLEVFVGGSVEAVTSVAR